LDFIALRLRYPIHVPSAVTRIPARPIPRDVILSGENMMDGQASERYELICGMYRAVVFDRESLSGSKSSTSRN
jgi:hypothetical protein